MVVRRAAVTVAARKEISMMGMGAGQVEGV
jgi:hypothetical protein